MARVFIKIFLCFFIFSTTLQASLFRDKIFIGEKKKEYAYFLSITEQTNMKDVEQKIINKHFSPKKNIQLLMLINIPKGLNPSEQKNLWNKVENLKTTINNTAPSLNVKVNGLVDTNLTKYEIHLYYR
ncbi:MAG: hypothetical protein LBH40_03445 [Alphaproteobacteria bacterium]|jgi:hypothetical protein|nr:hypothetical protein [Alphaproteobacteria bacterium]